MCGGYVAGEWLPLFASKCVGGMNMNIVKLNRTPNHAVGEVYKPAALNTHDPHEMYAWEKPVPAWVWALRALGALGFITGIYCLVFLGMLL